MHLCNRLSFSLHIPHNMDLLNLVFVKLIQLLIVFFGISFFSCPSQLFQWSTVINDQKTPFNFNASILER
jgi:hypothetical protein